MYLKVKRVLKHKETVLRYYSRNEMCDITLTLLWTNYTQI